MRLGQMLRDVDLNVPSVYSEVFADRLRVLLRRRSGGKLPKAAALASALRECSASADGRGVSPETVRRWIRGLAVPEAFRLSQLCRFLQLTPTEVSYLLVSEAVHRRGASAKRGAVDDSRPVDVRAVLHDWIDTIDDKALSAAYLSYLMSSQTHHFGALGGGGSGHARF